MGEPLPSSLDMTVRTTPAPWRAQFVALAVVWGSSFVCIKVLGRHWPPVDVSLGRVMLGALFLLGWLVVRRTPLPRGAIWRDIAVVAVLMNAVPFTLYAYGETKVSSVLAGLWNATTPLTTMVVLLTVIREERLDGRRLAGLAAGFAGVALLLGPWRGIGGGQWLGHVACFGAAVCYGLGSPYTRRHLSGRPESGVAIAAAQLLCATVMLAVFVPFAGLPTLSLGAGSWVSLAVLGVIILGEPLSWNEPVGAAVVLGAMWWSSRPGGGDRRGHANH